MIVTSGATISEVVPLDSTAEVSTPSSTTGVAVVFSLIVTPSASASRATCMSRSRLLMTPPQLGNRLWSGQGISITRSSPA